MSNAHAHQGRRERSPVITEEIAERFGRMGGRQPVSDIDTGVADSLKVLDPEWPIREADIIGSCSRS